MEGPNSTNSVEHESSPFTPAAPAPRGRKRPEAGKLTEWQGFFLERLEHLLGAQRENRAAGEAQSSLLSKAVYSTYLDCQEQGVGDEALQRITDAGSATPSA